MKMATRKISLVKMFALLILVLGVGQSMAVWDGVTTAEPSIEKIDGKDYYIIKTEENLAWFAAYTNDKENGKLNVNAKIDAKYLDMGHKSFVPISAGKGDRLFAGIFDGNNATIANLYINSEDLVKIDAAYGQNIGLIAALNGTVKNVFLENADIRAASDIGSILAGDKNKISVGTIVGWVKNGTIEGCYASGIIYNSGKGQAVGGIVGNADQGTIKDCLSTVAINIAGDNAYVGGIIGQAKTNVTIKECVYDSARFVNEVAASTGGVIGLRQDGVEAENNFYDNNNLDVGVASGDSVGVEGKYKLNTLENACILNGGTWDSESNTCDQTGVWANGDDRITNNGVGKDNLDETVYTIYFDANGGEFSKDAKVFKTLVYGAVLTDDEISKPFYADTSKVFWGWAFDRNAEEPLASLGTVLGVDTVFAVWKKTVEVTFNENHGTTPQTSVKKVAVGDEIKATVVLESYMDGEDRYYFAGWALSKTATEALSQLGVAAENVTYYAVWTTDPTYTVSFDINGVGSEVMAQHIKKEGKAVEPSLSADGYTFGGWYKEAACTNKFDFNTAITADTKLYAKWTENTYTITYNLDGGENSSENPSEYKVTSKTIVLQSPKDRETYRFGGWYYDAAFTERATQITEGSYGDVVLYAKWARNEYVVSYAAGSYGYGIIENSKKIHGQTLTLSSKTYTHYDDDTDDDSEKSAYYSQDGWALTDNGTVVYKLGGEYKKDSSIVLYPHWVKGVVLVYNEDGDTILVQAEITDTPDEILKKADEALKNHDPVIPTPTKTADDSTYTFAGWTINEETGWIEPSFKGTCRVIVITVKYGDNDGDTLHVKIYNDDVQEEINERINTALKENNIDLPVRGGADDSLYVLNWLKDEKTGFYMYSFNRFFNIDFNLPAKGRLVKDIKGYSEGLVTVLPEAYIDGDTTWKFKGWYEKTNGLGNRYKAMLPTDCGDKSIYPLFQKTVHYEVDGRSGDIVVSYSDHADRDIARALEGVMSLPMSVDVPHFSIEVVNRALEISGAKVGAKVAVYNAKGRVVTQGVVAGGTHYVEIPTPGNYIVRVNNQVLRVNVR